MNPQQKHCRCKNFFASERAVSTILAFVIITGILISAFAILMAIQVPQWTKETEATHAAKVPLSFAELDSVIDMAILRDDSSSSGCRLEMMPESVPAVGVHASAGMLEFNNSAEVFRFKACAPDAVADTDSLYWLSTPVNFSIYETYHVVTPDRGAELALEIGEDKIYDSGDEEYLAGGFWFNNFAVINNTTLYTSELAIHAMNITIGLNSSIIADYKGSAGGKYDDPGNGDGYGSGTIEKTYYENGTVKTISGNFSAGGGGAGHNGTGGNGGRAQCRGVYNSTGFYYIGDSWGEGGQGGSEYGNKDNSHEYYPGSGGGGGSAGRPLPQFGNGRYAGGKGGAGGGSVSLDAIIINIAGNISVNGEEGGKGSNAWDSAGGGGGGGSGGTILLKGDNVTITGNLFAKGGKGGKGGKAWDWDKYQGGPDYGIPENNGGGGGGGCGGRIKVFYDSNLSASNGLNSHVDVSGGEKGTRGSGGQGVAGEDGTPGVAGTVHNLSIPYSPQVYYYDVGYLISNVTATQGHIGYNTNTSLVCYGNMTWDKTVDEDTNIIMKVRTSINKSMHKNYTMSWDDCPPVANGTDISDLSSVSDGHRYVQWRAEFYTFDLSKTPVLSSVNISYEYGIPFIVNSSGSIRYSSQYTDFSNFKLIYAQGATLKKQTEGGLMLSAPPIVISKQQDHTKLTLTAMNLTGSDETLSGGFRATIKASDTNSELITGGLYFTNLTINITTEYPDVWEEWFNDTCEDAGLEFGTNPGNYNITREGNRLQIAFHGNETIPVNIWLKSAEAGIELKKKLLW